MDDLQKKLSCELRLQVQYFVFDPKSAAVRDRKPAIAAMCEIDRCWEREIYMKFAAKAKKYTLEYSPCQIVCNRNP
jgi:hypothetical protein